MKTLYNYSNYGNDLRITRSDANFCSQSGDCESMVIQVMNKPYIKRQLQTLDPAKLAKELKEYGTWDFEELQNHEQNLIRWVWLSCSDIVERN
jgi:hypothetical protein